MFHEISVVLLTKLRYKGRKSNTKSSITLPPAELKLVQDLQKKIGAKTKVEVIRRGLMKLKESTEGEALRASFAKAAKAVKKSTTTELEDLDHLSDEGLEKE